MVSGLEPGFASVDGVSQSDCSSDGHDQASATGTVKWKVVPWRCWLSNQIRPPLHFHQAAGDVEAQTCARHLSGLWIFGAEELLEDALLILG